MPASKYKGEESIDTARKLVALGATDIEIAEFLKITPRALYKWRHRHPEFNDALLEAKAEWDRTVERSLFQRAVGYDVIEDKIFRENGETIIVPTKKHIAPSVTAQIFWLKNRKHQQWRDVHQVEDVTPQSEGDRNLVEVARRLLFLMEQGIRTQQPQLIEHEVQT